MNIFWFRRDLRLEDNAGLFHALRDAHAIQPIFIFDKSILDKLENENDPRVSFIYEQIIQLKAQLNDLGSDLWVLYGDPLEVFKRLVGKNKIEQVFTNRDYESYAVSRDSAVAEYLQNEKINFNTYKDHVIFEGAEILKKDESPYVVFTPYKRKWLERLHSRKDNFYFKSYETEKYFDKLNKNKVVTEVPSLLEMGFKQSDLEFPSKEPKQSIIKNYDQQRDYPSVNGTSKLGIHYRFGTISIRDKVRKSLKLNQTYLSELIWRDFYSQILQHFPRVEKQAFRPKYENIEWRNNEDEFKAWQEGRTGYPIVDAGMRELNQTHHMHNRVRMIVASFLTKHLLIDWRWGEAYFADKLLDFDLASNNGGWQWAAGCGTDAAPYFRIFNPDSQQKKFDPKFEYIKKWVPEFGTDKYPEPIVDHKFARERCLRVYKEGINNT